MKRLIVGLFILTTFAFPTTINVPADQATIQAGLNTASTNDTVLVQPGTYTENIFWPNESGIKLISAGDSSNTIIDGNDLGHVITMTWYLDNSTLIKGFKITNVNSSNGGGFYIERSSPIIKNVVVTGNSASYGGGMYLYLNSSPTIENVTITENSGKGMYIFNNCNPSISNSNIFSNSGDGVYIKTSNPSISNSNIFSNSGDGIYINSGHPGISNSNIFSNSGDGIGIGGG